MSNQGEYPEDNRVGKHEPHDFSLTRRDLIKVSAATAATAVVYPHSTLAASVPAATPAPEIMGTVAKLAMRQPFVLFKGLTFQKLCLP
ncbi:twin-arginine translocation signal domain-containing protein, partial [Escherichia coli]|nr:twin-arginine translocation signal domain-containing protein [Escherichia coli]